MSLLKTFQTYQLLTPDQKQFIKMKIIEGAVTPDQWLALFRKVAEYDAYRDASSNRFGIIGCLAVLFGFVGFFVSVTTIYAFFIYVIVVLPLAIGLFVLSRQRKDVPNHLRRFILPMVAVLREEMAPDEQLYLRLDLRDGTLAEKRYSNQLSATGRRLQKSGSRITEEFFANYWLIAKGNLIDGTRLEIQLLDRIRKRSEGKRRTSGKYKTKTKHKIKTRIEAELQFKKSRYTVSKELVKSQAREAIQIKANDSRHVIRVRRNAVSSDLKTPVGVDKLFDTIAAAYRQVAPGSKS